MFQFVVEVSHSYVERTMRMKLTSRRQEQSNRILILSNVQIMRYIFIPRLFLNVTTYASVQAKYQFVISFARRLSRFQLLISNSMILTLSTRALSGGGSTLKDAVLYNPQNLAQHLRCSVKV